MDELRTLFNTVMTIVMAHNALFLNNFRAICRNGWRIAFVSYMLITIVTFVVYSVIRELSRRATPFCNLHIRHGCFIFNRGS